MKIFWSWQSDTPGKTGRHLVRNALNDAIEILKQQPDVEEADREALHLDHDIKDLAGSPDIVQAIFEKIQQSQVVVADVTLVGNVSEQTHSAPESSHKKLINSNVAIELGMRFGTCQVKVYLWY